MTWSFIYQSCTHDPIPMTEADPDPIDTMSIDTMEIDTMQMGTPCEPDVVYFQKDILPIFIGSCAIAGCHDATSAKDDVILDNFENIIETGDIEPFDLNGSKIYRVITEDDEDKVMPPTGKMDNAQINLIATWILQGAKDLECDEDQEPCDTENVSFSGFVVGVFQTHCNGCHGSTVANGGVITDKYEEVKITVDNGKLFGALNWEEGFSNMPKNQDQLDACTINKIKSWIDAGAKDN